MRTRFIRISPWQACSALLAVFLPAVLSAGPPPTKRQEAPHAHPKTEPLPPPQLTPAPAKPIDAAEAPLTIGELELLTLEHNPTLAQAAALVDISRARALQAGLYPNPTIGYDAEQMGLRGAGPGERQGAFIQQEIVTAGKLRLSRLKYQQEAFAAEIQAHAQRLRVINAIQTSFYEVLASERLVENHRRTWQNAEDGRKTTEELLNVGQANQPDLLQAEIEAQRARVALKNAENRHRRAWEHLAAVVGVPDLALRPVAGELEPSAPPLTRDAALQQILRDSPEIQFALAEVQRDEVTVQRERREPIPNLIVRGATGYNFESRTTTADLSVGVRLPIFDRNQGTIRQAQADLARARAEVGRVELVLRRRFAGAFQRYESALESAKDLREQSLPKAQKAYELYQDYFKKRRATWPQVLVAERTLSQLNEDYLNALLDLRRAEVEIRGLLLTQDGLNPPPGPTPQGHIEATPKPR